MSNGGMAWARLIGRVAVIVLSFFGALCLLAHFSDPSEPSLGEKINMAIEGFFRLVRELGQ
jgi:hypothetical protein